MPNSRIRYTLSEAIGDPQEWSFTWETKDDVTFDSCCDFCGQKQQRLTFEVARGSASLWICQRCVGRYPVKGTSEGRNLSPRLARNHIHGLTARLKQRTCQEVIRHLQVMTGSSELEEVAVYFDRNLQLSPQRAAILFDALGKSGEAIDPRIFDIQSRSLAHQEEFGALDEAARAAVWMALSSLQRRRLTSLGYAPSKTAGRQASPPRRDPFRQLTAPRMPAVNEPASPNPQAENRDKSIG